jgi:hypothetical protein
MAVNNAVLNGSLHRSRMLYAEDVGGPGQAPTRQKNWQKTEKVSY